MSVTLKILLCILLAHQTCRSEPLSGLVEPANPGEFPFVVSIARKFDITANNPYGHTCGGALITERHVLTAASCFAANRRETDYHVYAGSHDLARTTKYEIALFISYDYWLKNSRSCMARIFYENDIAVVKLVNKVLAPAQAAKILNFSSKDLEGKEVVTAGWGLTFDDTAPQHLLKADLKVIEGIDCLLNIRVASNDPTYNHESNVFCTEGVILFAVLDEGDKGSPVFMKHADGDYRIVGVNQNAAPSINEIVEIPDQQNKHVSLHNYFEFIRIVAGLRRTGM